MCTPSPARAFRYAGMVATRVFPSPVFISAMLPSCRTIAPITWTSKCRWPIVRRAASRTEANTSGSRSSRLSPASRRRRNSSSSGSDVLTMRTSCSRRLSFRPSPNWPIFSRPTVVPRVGLGGSAFDCNGGVGENRGRQGEPGRSSGDLEQLLPHGVDHCLHPGVQVELLQDVSDVVLHRVLRDVQLLRDVAVVHALCHQPEDLHLPVG